MLGTKNMPTNCHEMYKGQVYVCREYGLELEVVSECEDCGAEPDECDCDESCTFRYCGEDLNLRE